MQAPRERLIQTLTRIQRQGERTLFFLPSGTAGRLDPAGAEALDVTTRPAAAPRRISGAAATAEPCPASPERDLESQVEARWHELEERIRVCTLCRLCENRTNSVPGSGTRHTRLFIVGEGPGEQEDLRGEAFVGRAGELLTRILEAIGFERHEVFITNIVKCRPPRNRAPLPDEVAACAGYLDAQLGMVKPLVILTLGSAASQSLLQTSIPISRLRGRVHLFRDLPLIPTYHPAALLRSPQYKRPTWEDVQLLRRVYDQRMAGCWSSAEAREYGLVVAGPPSTAGVPAGAPAASPARALQTGLDFGART